MSVELSFNIDGTGGTLIHSDLESPSYQITELITLRKNSDPLNPDKGVDVNSYIQMVNDSDTLAKLKDEISKQISTYTPFIPSDVAVISKHNKFIIGIVLEGHAGVLYLSNDGQKTAFEILKEY